MRKLRNELEEVEDILDDTRTLGPDDLELLEKIAKSSEILHQLDLALQSYRCSKHIDVNESAISDFKTLLDITSHEVSLAFEAITTGEIELRLDTDILANYANVPKSPTYGQSSSSNTAESAYDRESSRTSSVWSSAPRDSPSQASTVNTPSMHSDGKVSIQPVDDKEVYDFGTPSLQVSPWSKSGLRSSPSTDWRAPFATLDPLSISIEQASSMILADDDDEPTSSALRSRSGTASAMSYDGMAVDRAKDDQEHVTSEATSTVAGQYSIETNVQDSRPSEGILESNTTSVSRQSVDSVNTLGAGNTTGLEHEVETPEDPVPVGSNQPPRPPKPSSHLSPKSAASEFVRRSRTDSITSASSVTRPPEATGKVDENEHDKAQVNDPEDLSLLSPHKIVTQKNNSSNQEAETTIDNLATDLSSLINRAFDGEKSEKPLPTPPIVEERSFEPKVLPNAPQSPSMPTRRPPPPPKPRRTSTRARPSSYRIVNAAPLDESSSDDELYSSSKPASPIAARQSAISTEIPRVSIDASACEEDQAAPKVSAPSTQKEEAGPSNSQSSDVAPQVKLKSPEIADATDFDDREPSRTAILPNESPENSKPAIPKRPERARYQRKQKDQDTRPAPAFTHTSPAAIPQETSLTTEKELAPETGLEVRGSLAVSPKAYQLRERVSVDAALKVRSPSVSTQSTSTMRDNGRHTRSASTSQIDSGRPQAYNTALTGFYAPGVDSTHPTELEVERINHIVHFWNIAAWDQAEAYLNDYLQSLVESDAPARARRVRHLLGVCASFKGEWARSIPLFLSAMKTPISNISDIDDGDCAAAYWLGDMYSLLNLRTEALLAYCIAERSSLFHDSTEPALADCVTAEQEAVQLGVSKADFKARWTQEAFNGTSSTRDSVLDTSVITTATAKMLLESEPRRTRRATVGSGSDSPFRLNPSSGRSNSLFCLNKLPRVGKYHRMKLNTGHFEPETSWPMMYDPLFAMANVQRGRLLAYECDLLAVFTSNPEARIPKSGPLGLGRMDCFTCTDLPWLIRTIRECLRMLEMEFSEVANVEGTWFVVRYTFMQTRIATTHYFSIALFKQTFRGGFGADICPDGICSARIICADYEHDKGVHQTEAKRIKKLIREYLDEAAKQAPNIKPKRKGSTSEADRAESVPNSKIDDEAPPPLPPRP